MKLPVGHGASHPQPELLALYARGDLPFVSRLRLRGHLLECSECEAQIRAFTSSAAELKREASTQTLTAFEAIADWNTLEREMLGNIVVGVAAARCIDNVGRKRVWLPRLGIAAGLAALFVAGWITHIPREQSGHLAASLSHLMRFRPTPPLGNEVRTTPTGIAVRSEGITLTILHPPTAFVSVSGSASVEARYVDEDTGQMTITNVYGQ